MATIEERLAAIEARLTPDPQALTPPITIGSLTTVPAPGSQLAAAWAQQASTRIVHAFPTKAAIDGWAAPDGCRAVQTDNGREWRRIGASWSLVTPWFTSAAGVVLDGVQSGIVSTVGIPSDPYTRIADVAANFRIFVGDSIQVTVGIQVANVDQVQAQYLQGNHNVSLHATNIVVAANVATQVTTVVVVSVPGAGSYQTFAGPLFNRLDVGVFPRSF
jgi:hypothetical protein